MSSFWASKELIFRLMIGQSFCYAAEHAAIACSYSKFSSCGDSGHDGDFSEIWQWTTPCSPNGRMKWLPITSGCVSNDQVKSMLDTAHINVTNALTWQQFANIPSHVLNMTIHQRKVILTWLHLTQSIWLLTFRCLYCMRILSKYRMVKCVYRKKKEADREQPPRTRGRQRVVVHFEWRI